MKLKHLSTLLLISSCFLDLSLYAQENIDSLIQIKRSNYDYEAVIQLINEIEQPTINQENILAEAQLKSGRLNEALFSYKSLYGKDSADTYLIQQAMIYEKLNEEEKALAIYNQLINREKTNPYFWKKAARAAERSGNYEYAFAAYQEALRLQDRDLESSIAYSKLLIKAEQYQIADSLIKEALNSSPDNVQLLKLRVNLLYKQKRYKELVAASEEIFAQNDSSLVIQKLSGISNYHLMEYEKSIALLEEVVEVDKESDVLHYYLGLAYREAGMHQKATELLEKAIDLAVSNNLPNYYTQLAVSYEEEGQTAKAIQAYKIAYKETKDKVLLYHLARNYDLYYKDKSVALNYYERYIEEKDTANEYLTNYSKHRIQELKASVHFEVDSF